MEKEKNDKVEPDKAPKEKKPLTEEQRIKRNKMNMTSTTFSLTLGGRESSLSRSLPFIPFTFSWIVLIGFPILAIFIVLLY